MAGRSGKTDAEKLVEGEIAKMDLYGLLDVDEDAREKAIVKAYRKMALKYHPDKNPDDPRAAEMFHKLSTALQILTDAAARAAYDKIVKARKAFEERNRFLDSKRKKFKDELEQRERNIIDGKQNMTPDISQTDKLKKEIDRLRKEGSKMLEEEQERMKEEIKAERARQAKQESESPKLKVKWRASKGDPKNGGYNHSILEKLFAKYGPLSALIISKKKSGTAVIEFAETSAAVLAQENELGLVENPLTVTWLSGKPEDTQHDFTVPTKHHVPSYNSDVLSGFSFNTNPAAVGIDTRPNEDSTSMPKSKWDSETSTEDSSTATADDFESLVLRNLRQAQERKRLEDELRQEDD